MLLFVLYWWWCVTCVCQHVSLQRAGPGEHSGAEGAGHLLDRIGVGVFLSFGLRHHRRCCRLHLLFRSSLLLLPSSCSVNICSKGGFSIKPKIVCLFHTLSLMCLSSYLSLLPGLQLPSAGTCWTCWRQLWPTSSPHWQTPRWTPGQCQRHSQRPSPSLSGQQVSSWNAFCWTQRTRRAQWQFILITLASSGGRTNNHTGEDDAWCRFMNYSRNQIKKLCQCCLNINVFIWHWYPPLS